MLEKTRDDNRNAKSDGKESQKSQQEEVSIHGKVNLQVLSSIIWEELVVGSADGEIPSLCPQGEKDKHWARHCQSKYHRDGIPLLGNGKGA